MSLFMSLDLHIDASLPFLKTRRSYKKHVFDSEDVVDYYYGNFAVLNITRLFNAVRHMNIFLQFLKLSMLRITVINLDPVTLEITNFFCERYNCTKISKDILPGTFSNFQFMRFYYSRKFGKAALNMLEYNILSIESVFLINNSFFLRFLNEFKSFFVLTFGITCYMFHHMPYCFIGDANNYTVVYFYVLLVSKMLAK